MKRSVCFTLLNCLILSVFCLSAVSEPGVELAASSSDAKFTDRISKKQELLAYMGQDMQELKKVCLKRSSKKKTALPEKEISDAAVNPVKREYIKRMEKKLSLLVNESLKDMNCTKHATFQPMMPGNLIPESRFDSVDMEKEIKEDRRE